MSFPAGKESNFPLRKLPNELLVEVASNLESFKDLNSLVRTSHAFHTLLNTDLYRRAVATDDAVREDIVEWALSNYPIASLKLLFYNGLSVHHTLGEDSEELLRWICSTDNFGDRELSVSLAELLIERGADINEKDPIDSSTPLHLATSNGNEGMVALLLANGAEVDARTSAPPNRYYYSAYGAARTPLHLAVRNRDQDSSMIDLLIAHGADVNARDCDGNTPLLLAASQGNMRLIPTLLGYGADARACNMHPHTALHLLSYHRSNSDHALVKALVEHGADVNAADEKGCTPLHLEVLYGRLDGLMNVKFLLENGADVNARMGNGCSLLKLVSNHIRANKPRRRFHDDLESYGLLESSEGCRTVMRLLIAHGADVSVLTKEERAMAQLSVVVIR